jgi:hypothetical protein
LLKVIAIVCIKKFHCQLVGKQIQSIFAIMLSIILLPVLITAQAPKYGKCDAKKFGRIDLVNKTLPIVSVLQASPITIKGSIAIVDGCNFETRDFEFLNAGVSYWVGGYKGSDDAMTLSDDFVTASAFKKTVKYSLKSTAGSEANFDGFDQFRLFERNTKVLIAIADMPAKISSPDAANTKSQANSFTFGFGALIAAALAMW